MIILFRYTSLGNLSKERKYNEKKCTIYPTPKSSM